MADEIRVTRDPEATGAPHTHPADIAAGADVEATIPAHPTNTMTGSAPPPDPEVVRTEIERTRARMSGTIEEIEDALTRRKEKIQDRLDVFGPIRERPLPSAGVALGAGLLLGLLTGGGHDEGDRSTRDRSYRSRTDEDEVQHWRNRAETWESRARRLRDIAREQEEELQSVQEQWGEARARGINERGGADFDTTPREEEGHLSSALGEIRDTMLHGLTGFLSTAVSEFLGQEKEIAARHH